MSNVIELSSVSKVYQVYKSGRHSFNPLHYFRREQIYIPAVKDVSFVIEAGEIVGFLGGNGAGKTTTLKMLSGITRPTAGHLSVLGHEPFKRRPDFLKSIALVMGQKQQLSWDLPALESLQLQAVLYDIPAKERQRRIEDLCVLLSADDIIHRPVRKLSLGERMKCELILSLLHYPRILFLDEPTIGLDLTQQATIRKFLLDYNKEFGATIIITSHYMADIEALADRIIVLDKGAIAFDGDRRKFVKSQVSERKVSLKFSFPVSKEALMAYGSVIEVEGHGAEILISDERLTTAVAELLATFPVVDIAIQCPSLEQAFPRLMLEKEVH